MNSTAMPGNTKDSVKRGAVLQEKVNSIIKKLHYKYNLVLEGVCGSHLSDVIFFSINSRTLF